MIIDITTLIEKAISNIVPQLINPLYKKINDIFLKKSDSVNGGLNILESSSSEIVKAMGAGWNLGNSLDSWDDSGTERTNEEWETLWKNPLTTFEMIKKVSEKGFKTLRIPVTYRNHFESDNKTIKSEWLDRVEEVVNYGLSCGMFVIINVHHDSGTSGILTADKTKLDSSKSYLVNLWEQIGTRFAKYDYRLMFEGFNELVNTSLSDKWKGDEDSYQVVNELNQAFVDTVRKQAGNENRFLICTTYGAQVRAYHCSAFVLPTDIVEDKLLVEVHSYNKTIETVYELVTVLEKYFINKNIPVLIGESGTKDINKDKDEGMVLEDRIKVTNLFVTKLRELGIPVIVWDNNNGSYQLLDREDLEWKFPTIAEEIIKLSNSIKKIEYKYLDDDYQLFDESNWRIGRYNSTGLFTPYLATNTQTSMGSMRYVKPRCSNYSISTKNYNLRTVVSLLDKNMDLIDTKTIVNGNFSVDSYDSKIEFIGLTIYEKNGVFELSGLINEIKDSDYKITKTGEEIKSNEITRDDVEEYIYKEKTETIIVTPEYYSICTSSDTGALNVVKNVTDSSTQILLTKINTQKTPEDLTSLKGDGTEYVKLIPAVTKENKYRDTIYREKDDSYSKQEIDEKIDDLNNTSSFKKYTREITNCKEGVIVGINFNEDVINLTNSMIQLFKYTDEGTETYDALNLKNDKNLILANNNSIIFDSESNMTLNTEFSTNATLNSDGLYETEIFDKTKIKNLSLSEEV